MTFQCLAFLEAAGIKEEFENLCANAGLTRLATCRVTQYHTLTSCFINIFRFVCFDLFEVFACSSLFSLNLKKTTKSFSFLLLSFNPLKTQKYFVFSL